MKLSIIIAFYQSYGVMERQVKYFKSLNLTDDVEFIFVDDGSEPAHPKYDLKNLTMHYTNDKRPWTQGLARNAGAKLARGEYLLMTDADHILSKEVIEDCLEFKGDRLIFPRYLAVLLADGSLTQDKQVLLDYGVHPERFVNKRGLYASYHGNTFCIKRETFMRLGMYDEAACLYGHHAVSKKGEDSYFNTKWNHYAVKENIKVEVGRAMYMFPIGRYHVNYELNPKGLFHKLSYEAVAQPNKE